ncbi:Transposon Ty4-J Gag-Pol polyprotein [Porphyridium purpureum]|uniref:Transposon Ty4-J Gag-Pol polyprotein n=1 Tax=Porphyridium purpureum TaxID=35688 RepID=A0A5J4YGU6_PORPP|nr:Transposon Ty4-J Gag-Pol polyprotein [Porphyridium purpureum]|eukprot:POR4206..scf276_29
MAKGDRRSSLRSAPPAGETSPVTHAGESRVEHTDPSHTEETPASRNIGAAEPTSAAMASGSEAAISPTASRPAGFRFTDRQREQLEARPWVLITTGNPEWDALLRESDKMTQDEFAYLFINGVMTENSIRDAGPLVTLMVFRYATWRGIFDEELTLAANIARFAPVDEQVRRAPTPPPQVTAPFQASHEEQENRARDRFLRAFSESHHLTGGADTGPAFTLWRRQVETNARIFGLSDSATFRTLPLISIGVARDAVDDLRPQRLAAALDQLESKLSSSGQQRAHRRTLGALKFGEIPGDTRVGAFDKMVNDIRNRVPRAGPSAETVDEYVLQAMLRSTYGAEIALASADRSGPEFTSQMRVFLGAKDSSQPNNSGSSALFYGAPPRRMEGPANRPNDPSAARSRAVSTVRFPENPNNRAGEASDRRVQCQHCGRMGHTLDTCWRRSMPANEARTIIGLTDYEYDDAITQAQSELPITRSAQQGIDGCDDDANEADTPTRGESVDLAPAHHSEPIVWGTSYPVLGDGTVRVALGSDHFLQFTVAVVAAPLPIILGTDVVLAQQLQVQYGRHPTLTTASGAVEKLQWSRNNHLLLGSGQPRLLATLLYTQKELDTMHKRFGHASAPQMLKLLRLAGEPLDAVQRRELEERIAQCSTCQWYRGNRSTFKIAADVEVSFNHTVSMDFVFLETHKTLHAVCNGTKFQMAMFCGEDATATGVYRIFFNNWIAIFGAPHRVVVDKERVTVSHDLRVLLEAECCALVDIPVEAHWSLGQVERYHEPLRKVFLRVAREAPDLTAHDQLAITVRALNVTCGPEGIIPALLVFGTVPRMQLRPEVAQHDHMETQAGRIAAIFAARNEFEKWISARKLAQARRSRAPSYPNAAPGHEITPGTAVLVRRESAYEWQGPYIALKVDAPRVTVVLPSTVSAARARQQEFHINNVKVYRLETPATLFVDTPASVQDLYKTFPQASATSNASWDDADLLELNGIINRQVLEPCPDLPAMANVIGSRMERVVKSNGQRKSRFIAQGHRDSESHITAVNAPTLTRFMLRSLISTSVVNRWSLTYRDYTQAYLQSRWPLARQVFLKLKPEIRVLLARVDPSNATSIVNKSPAWPAHARIRKPLYGLADSGTYWHATVHSELLDKGFIRAALDPCVYYSNNPSHRGMLGILVDDCLFTGTPPFLAAEQRVSSRLDNKGLRAIPFTFNGFEISSVEGAVATTHQEYAQRELTATAVSSFEEFRRLRGKLMYIAFGTRPDIACAVAKSSQITEQTYTRIHGAHLLDLAAMVRSTPRAIVYAPLTGPLRLRVFADASYASNDDGSSQLGYVIFLGDQSSRVHLLHYASHKARQVCHSVLSAELLALCLAYDMAEALQVELMRTGMDAPIELATDSKQIFDAASRSTILAEKRLMVRMMLLREGLSTLRIRQILHVPGKSNIADALTKPRACPLWDRVLTNGQLEKHAATQVCLMW